MNPESPATPSSRDLLSPGLQQRASHRFTITMPDCVYRRRLQRADVEGRSSSNLAAFLLEKALSAGLPDC